MMTVFINEQPANCAENTTLSQFLQQQHIDTLHIAVAINDSVVFRKKWDSAILSEGCKILIIKATQGG